MGKPLNVVEQGCNPISSNCVIWQGPDIQCINLCNGDTVSDVVYKLATELCNIMEILNITTYEEALACFNLAIGAGAPGTFEQMIELLIARVCNLEKCTGCRPDCTGDSHMTIPDEVTTNCCDTLIDIASCFYYEDEHGDTVTQMTLNDYAHTLGNKICDILTALQANNIILKNLDTRVTILEEKAAPFYQPEPIIPVCVLPAVPTDPFLVLSALEVLVCNYQQILGTPNIISSETSVPTDIMVDDQLCNPGTPMTALYGWINGGKLADNINNMWLTILDMRCAIQNALACCPTVCQSFVLSINAMIQTSYLKIWYLGSVPANFHSCNIGGVQMTVTDTAGGSATFWVDFISLVNSGNPYSIDLSTLPVNPALNFTITGIACVQDNNSGSTCERVLSYNLINTAPCPLVVLGSPTSTTITYSFTGSTGVHNYVVALYNADGSVEQASFTHNSISGGTPVSGLFTGLTSGTTYRVRVSVVTGGINSVTCPDYIVNTISDPCYPPTGVSSTIGLIES